MIPNVTRGDRMAGLMTYLTGPGRANEHTDPHLVAGTGALMSWYDDNELGRDAALAIARHLERPREVFGTDVSGGHVWHCSLSVGPDDGLLPDQQWGDIARDFISEMGFDDNEGTKAECRWAAVRHGTSKNGNDHIHLVVNLVREDGTKASIHNDFKRAQKASRELEVKYGLVQLESVRLERATRGSKPAEFSKVSAEAERIAKWRFNREEKRSTWSALPKSEQAALVDVELKRILPRNEIARRVRACSTASKDEAEFVRRMRGNGLLVRPRYAEGSTSVVTGFSVAARPTDGSAPVWYGGGTLGRDLTLPRLREAWESTPEGASNAVKEWDAARRGRRVVAPGAEQADVSPQTWAASNDELKNLVARLKDVPLEDRDTWSQVARHTAGAFASWSMATESVPGDLASAADALAKSAQTKQRPRRPDSSMASTFASAARVLTSASNGGQGAAAQLAMMKQLMQLAKQVWNMNRAAGAVRAAADLRYNVRSRLDSVHTALTAGAATASLPVELQAQMDRVRAASPPQQSVSVLPPKLDPTPPRTPVRRGPDRDGFTR